MLIDDTIEFQKWPKTSHLGGHFLTFINTRKTLVSFLFFAKKIIANYEPDNCIFFN